MKKILLFTILIMGIILPCTVLAETMPYVKNLTLSEGNIDFAKEITEYNITVPNHVDKIKVEATLENNETTEFVAEFGPREMNLQEGQNDFILKVKNKNEEDTVRTYTIHINRKKAVLTLSELIEKLKVSSLAQDYAKNSETYNINFVNTDSGFYIEIKNLLTKQTEKKNFTYSKGILSMDISESESFSELLSVFSWGSQIINIMAEKQGMTEEIQKISEEYDLNADNGFMFELKDWGIEVHYSDGTDTTFKVDLDNGLKINYDLLNQVATKREVGEPKNDVKTTVENAVANQTEQPKATKVDAPQEEVTNPATGDISLQQMIAIMTILVGGSSLAIYKIKQA